MYMYVGINIYDFTYICGYIYIYILHNPDFNDKTHISIYIYKHIDFIALSSVSKTGCKGRTNIRL